MQPPLETSSLSPQVIQMIQELMIMMDLDAQSQKADLIGQIIASSLKMASQEFDMGQLKLMTRAFKEMRYAYQIFNQHRKGRCVSIFGSARTPEDHPDYLTAKAFSSAMAAQSWVCMTGAANGIMQAGLEGAQKEASFGLSIRLPFETTTHTILTGDPKLINFRYFFTRKLMFLSQSDALAAFPGGVGTQDELFEALTLMQTGKANIVPLILLEGEGGTYWQEWQRYLCDQLFANGCISQEDFNLFYPAPNVQSAVDHILHFYRRYHSSRYVKDMLVLRMLTPLTEEQIQELNQDFQPLFKDKPLAATLPFPEEQDHLHLPRLAFEHNHKHFGLLRALIDRINSF